MSSQTLSDKQIITDLGVDALVGLGYSEVAVKKWMQSTRGIPWRERAKVAELARAKRKKLPADFLMQQRRVEA